MAEPDPRLRDYHQDGRYWTGIAHVPFWGGDLPIWFDTYDKQPNPRQLSILRTILDHPQDLRLTLEEALFNYYKADVEGCIDFGSPEAEEECAPHLTQPSQIWRLLDQTDIWIDTWYGEGKEHLIEFKMMFTCTWDEEHGLGVKFRDWKIVGFGGAVS